MFNKILLVYYSSTLEYERGLRLQDRTFLADLLHNAALSESDAGSADVALSMTDPATTTTPAATATGRSGTTAAPTTESDSFRSANVLPVLKEGSYKSWWSCLQSLALETDSLTQLMVQTPPPAAPIDYLKKEARLNRLITASVHPNVTLATVAIALGDTFYEIQPFQKIKLLAEHFESTTSEGKHDMLLSEAEAMKIHPSDDAATYFGKHFDLRLEMQRADHPHKENKKTTVKFIIAGIRARPSLI